MKRKDWLNKLKSDEGTFTAQQKNAQDERIKLANKIRERVGAGGQIEIIGGVFGEWLGCDGMVEEVIKPAWGGTFVKIYGCSYLFKGYPDKNSVRGMDMSKAMVSAIPREIIGRSFLLSGSLIILFLFFRKRFIGYLDRLFTIINERNLHYEIPKDEYCGSVKEIKRAVAEALSQEINDWSVLVGKITRFGCLFLERDTAYRFRVQDAFGELNPNAKNSVKELFRILDIMISRERSKSLTGGYITDMIGKWKFIKSVLQIALFTSPQLKKIISRIIKNIDPEKIKMDDADWYFCLRYLSYDFGGKNREWRFAERDRIDKEKGHIFLL